MNPDTFILMRLLVTLPAIFLVSYLVIGLVFTALAAIWPYLLGAFVVAMVLAALFVLVVGIAG